MQKNIKISCGVDAIELLDMVCDALVHYRKIKKKKPDCLNPFYK